MATPLLDAVAARAPDAARALGAPADAEAQLARLIAAAAAAWPAVVLAPADVAAAIGERLATDEPPALGAELANELHLALGCARGDAAAIAVFEQRYLDVVAPALSHMKLPAATVDDVRAAVRDKLLLAEAGARPKILDYAGQGRLRGLVQVSAVRTAISILRQTDRELPLADDGAALPGLDPAADLQLIKAQYRAAFAAAFAAAVGALERRDRALLRLHFLGSVTLEALATMYGVHRATIVRWLAAARERILRDTRKRLQGELGIAADELDDVLGMISSQLDVSVRRLLASIEISRT